MASALHLCKVACPLLLPRVGNQALRIPELRQLALGQGAVQRGLLKTFGSSLVHVGSAFFPVACAVVQRCEIAASALHT